MALSYLFDPNKQFQDKNGVNNVGGYLYVFINDSDDHAPTYCNFTGALNPERIVLDNNGRAVVIVDELKTYRIEVYDRSGNMLWSQYPVRPTNVLYGDYNVYNADIYGTPDEIDVDVEMSASGVKKFTIKLANAVKTVIGNIQDTISSIVETVSTKADKVQGATAGNLASIDASGNLADSGKKTADFKTKQTAVTDPTADGTGLSFIDSVTQNTNGEITPHKKTVQDGTTAQKGVVQLQDSIGSTESATDKAVTPHAVREAINTAVSSAYHAAGTKTVAQLTSSLLVAVNEGCVYNVTDSGTTTSDFVEGAGHPITAGANVVVCDIGGGVYKFDLLSGFVDFSNYLAKTGDASNTTSTLTKNASDTSSMTSGNKLSVLFTAISNFFASLKALAFKDTIGTSDIVDGAITAAKVKDNETLPVNVSGEAGFIRPFIIDKNAQTTKVWAKVATASVSAWKGYAITLAAGFDGYADANSYAAEIAVGYQAGNGGVYANRQFYIYRRRYTNTNALDAKLVRSGNTLELWVKDGITDTNLYLVPVYRKEFSTNYADSNNRSKQLTDSAFTTYIADKTSYNAVVRTTAFIPDIAQVGSPSTPVYVDSNGQVQPCTPSSMSVTPDGTSTGYDLGNSTTLKAFAQKFKNLVGALKALAFKDKVSDSDISGTISDNHIASASTWNGKADKASSGNGMLAVIGSNGNYGSSGITAYNQTQINSFFSGKVIPSLQKRSQIDEQIYEFICNGSTVGKAVKFTDEIAEEDRLTFGLEFVSDGTILQFYLPINNYEENEWIWDGQTPGGSPVGVVELYVGCIKNTNGTIAPFSGHSEHAIDAYNGSSVISVEHFGGINVGSTTRANDSYSKVNIVMKITNTITGKYVVVTFDLGVTSFANGSANQAYAIGVARCNSYGFNS